ncbi:helix-turn-helix domain-containing protein [Streptomyces sp. HUAS TT20]|uniref:helix-turn-helix domain-containing protein n=1 Tax=Streptomyces sp. HUAS TT20 TaxID=3447509 RepID=UPI0021DB101D|nr:helix-turn-helix transcriptional regulator [Streptomyces sp. HUAS 15-9]UXY27894.1 helix-turn-helix transcriptional regulator [Streptomyces sp. HUAS 15-9]
MASGESRQAQQNWRYCGGQIKLWREEAGVSRQALAEEAGYDGEYVKSMECGRRRPTLRLLQIADQLCGARGKLVAAHEFLKPEKFLSYAEGYVRYEAEAISLSFHQPLHIPGLLQTEETMRALLDAYLPPLDDETIEERVAGRLERQALLGKQTRAFSFAIGEAALKNPVGGVEAHRRQLLRLVEAGEARNVTIQVLQFVGAGPGVDGPFVLVEAPEHELLVYEEGQETGSLYADADKVSAIVQRHAMILRQALNPGESARFITKLAEEL